MGIIEKMQAEINELKAQVAELQEKQPAAISEWTEFTGTFGRPEPTRAEVIEKAKESVSDITYEMPMTTPYNFVDFAVNKEKRTVAALLRIFGGYSPVAKKGIAKCGPDDCFNVHIGKAIALYRALGLEVPKEFLNAPQPTEVRVGDIVEYRWIDGSDIDIDRDVVEKVEGNEVTYANDGGWDPLDYILKRGDSEQLVWVCDDSREGE